MNHPPGYRPQFRAYTDAEWTILALCLRIKEGRGEDGHAKQGWSRVEAAILGTGFGG